MANQELLDYIMRQRSHGANSSNIKEALLKAGWDPKDVEEGIATTEPAPAAAPLPAAAPSVLTQSPATPAVQPFMPAMSTPASAPAPATMPTSAPQLPYQAAQAPASVAAAPMGTSPMSSVMMSPTPPSTAPTTSPVMPPVATGSPIMPGSATAFQPAAASAPAMAAAPQMAHPAMPSVQIPSANFMPKVDTPHVAPLAPPVTTVMPSMQVPAEQKSHLGLIVGILAVVLILLGGGGFAYWKFMMQPPAPIIPADQPAVQDVVVTPEPLPTENAVEQPTSTAPEGGMVAFPSSIPVATSTEATTTPAATTTKATTTKTTTTTTTTTTTSAPAPTPKKSATSTSVLPPGAM